jgi:hypothetical protein
MSGEGTSFQTGWTASLSTGTEIDFCNSDEGMSGERRDEL